MEYQLESSEQEDDRRQGGTPKDRETNHNHNTINPPYTYWRARMNFRIGVILTVALLVFVDWLFGFGWLEALTSS